MRKGLLEGVASFLLLVMVTLAITILYLGYVFSASDEAPAVARSEVSVQPTPTTPDRTPTPIPGRRVGILAGHWKSDSGAICSDGLQEGHITLDVARGTVELLQAQGFQADLLPEVGPELEGYSADAFVSIHADSCIYSASGFKAARYKSSTIPDVADRLVSCLYDEYEAATGLSRHDRTVTPNMTFYHAFRKKDAKTPGAIIELGFMGSDQEVLIRGRDRMVLGVVNGILCFFGEPSLSPTPRPEPTATK